MNFNFWAGKPGVYIQYYKPTSMITETIDLFGLKCLLNIKKRQANSFSLSIHSSRIFNNGKCDMCTRVRSNISMNLSQARLAKISITMLNIQLYFDSTGSLSFTLVVHLSSLCVCVCYACNSVKKSTRDAIDQDKKTDDEKSKKPTMFEEIQKRQRGRIKA